MQRKFASGCRTATHARIKHCACAFVLLLLLFVALVDGISYNEFEEPVVNIKWGSIRGKWSNSLHGRSIASFLGIPYALPPLGDLRFKSPQRWNRTWTTIRDGTTNGAECIQYVKYLKGSEDCLYLNVFVPAPKIMRTKKLPVMFYVYGGSFKTGSNQMYLPDYMLDHDIVLVVINYRLDILGFFSTMSRVSPGNYGLKDMVMALKWVQENIHNFDGDPKSVTIVGGSSGASAVSILALSNKTEGLFNRYILHAGSALDVWAIAPGKQYREVALKTAQKVGCLPGSDRTNKTIDAEIKKKVKRTTMYDVNTAYDERMVECMKHVNASKLVLAVREYFIWLNNPNTIFAPTLEDESEDALVTEHPLKVLKEQRFRNLPVIIQLSEDEGLTKTAEILVNSTAKNEMIQNFDKLIHYTMEHHYVIRDANIKLFATALKNFYFNGNESTNFDKEITNMVGDGMIRWGAVQLLEYLSALKNSRVYFSLFAYKGTFSFSFATNTYVPLGVQHNDDVNYIFPILNTKFRNLMLHNTEKDITMIHIMTEIWMNFVKDGVPKAWMIPEWPNFRDHHQFMKFGNDSQTDVVVQSNFIPERMKFWRKLRTEIPLEESDFKVFINNDLKKTKGNASITHSGPEILLALIIIMIFFLIF